MNTLITGQCLCGSITYRCEAEPGFSLLCQCTQCQKITGAGHSAQFSMSADTTVILGTVKTYTLTSDAGNSVVSAFCPTCGNPIYKTTSVMPDAYFFHAATLDDPSLFKPEIAVYANSAQHWDFIDPDVKRQ